MNTEQQTALEQALRARVQQEESNFSKNDRGSNSLWDHLSRVATLAQQIGRAEGVPVLDCRLAALFHDAGKFNKGTYHKDDAPEEERACKMLEDFGRAHNVPKETVERVNDAIRQIYRDDPEPDDLAKVLFDADNLDKLGPLGVANYFVKSGLRGGGVSANLLYRLTVELTYARHAPSCLLTPTGRGMAAKRAPETTAFLHHFVHVLNADGLYDCKIEQLEFKGLVLDVVAPSACHCGGPLKRHIHDVAGMKCTEIHLSHTCQACGDTHNLRFCRPRLAS